MNRLDVKPTRKGLGELAYESLRDSIVSMELEPGQMVSEFELASQLGVSRTPVREAFRLLMQEEFIDVMPQRGARITLISQRKVEETRFVRECLEVRAFEEVAEQWDNSADKYTRIERQIRLLFQEQEQALQQNESFRFLQLDEDFHRTVIELCGNRTLLNVVTSMRGHLNRVRYLSLQEMGTMANLVREHEAILDAITKNDVHLVEEVLSHHLRRLTVELPRIVELHKGYFTL
ncbi:GntR family transcriptional regulator [Alicyclobacillus curvatus]|jgi:GntR family transcriptional regulator, rspAB operon transcriptional repressor|nr:GntR family transcriptional regulator [Alicyclobacillus curvatus]